MKLQLESKQLWFNDSNLVLFICTQDILDTSKVYKVHQVVYF